MRENNTTYGGTVAVTAAKRIAGLGCAVAGAGVVVRVGLVHDASLSRGVVVCVVGCGLEANTSCGRVKRRHEHGWQGCRESN